MGTNGVLWLHMEGDYLYNRLSSDNVIIRLKFGGSTVVGDAWTIGATSATRAPWWIEARVSNRAATNSQLVTLLLRSTQQGSPTAGIGLLGGELASRYSDGLIQNTAAVDTTADQTLQITAQWNNANVSNSFRKRLTSLHLAQN
jgi:hypothetical protein